MTSARSILLTLLLSFPAYAEDWPMGGRAGDRNPVSPEKDAPTDWQIAAEGKPARNIRWSARTGWRSFGGPVVSNGLVWVGTNNDEPRDPAIRDDGAVLMCFRESDGKFLYQSLSKRLRDWPQDAPRHGLASTPLIEGDYLWFVDNNRRVTCLDIGPLVKGTGEPRVFWKYDTVAQLDTFPRTQLHMSAEVFGSPVAYENGLFVPTGNGCDETNLKFPKPNAPAFIALDKRTGKLLWKDYSPNARAMALHYASPTIADRRGGTQVVVPQSDGFVRGFDAETGKMLWEFDVNPAGVKRNMNLVGPPSSVYVLATPVFSGDRLYFGVGRCPEAGFGKGRLFCIDPTKRGDISKRIHDGKSATARPNFNSGLLWEYAGPKENPDGMRLTLSSAAVAGDLLVACDTEGHVHCLDAATGKPHWTHDARSGISGNPLIVDGKIYCGCDDGAVWILELARTKRIIAKLACDAPILASPAFANGTLYIATERELLAIGGKK